MVVKFVFWKLLVKLLSLIDHESYKSSNICSGRVLGFVVAVGVAVGGLFNLLKPLAEAEFGFFSHEVLVELLEVHANLYLLFSER